ncbi:MAG: hypothetical protein HY520_03885, partial [Candidatus Aenigmarchaeota archaeon]|nr:hypothetical protein [Candidatus Aenigmarchaeota archaeon]
SITWRLGDLKANQTVPLAYTFNPPNLSPAIHLAGPARVGHAGGDFDEPRAWAIAADAVFDYYVKWRFDWNHTTSITDPLTLCTNETYNLSTVFMDLADDTETNDLRARLQIKPEGDAIFTQLPYAGWGYWQGGRNNQTIPDSELGTANNDCQNNLEDHCYVQNHTISLVGALNRTYTLQFRINVSANQMRDNSDLIQTRVINCSNVNLVRDIKVSSPSGEDGTVIRGHMALVAVPIANYNRTDWLSGNVTVTILNGTEEVGWFFWDNRTQNFTLPNRGELPPYPEQVLLYRFEVPESASDDTYTIQAFIDHNGSSSVDHVLTKSFALQDSGDGTKEPVIIYTAAPNVPTCDGGSGPSGQHFRVNVCNYGDYNLTVNVTVAPSSLSTTDAPGVIEGQPPNISTTDDIQWHNRPLNTSTCFMSAFFIRGSDDIVPASFTTEVVWVDPVTGAQKFISKKDLTDVCGGGINSVHSGSTNPVMDVLEASPDSELDVNLFERTGAGTTTGLVYMAELRIPAGFNVTAANFTLSPDTGYPIGSPFEGFDVRWTFSPTPLSVIGLNSTTLLSGINLTTENIGNITPGGKVFYHRVAGYSGQNKGQWWTKQRVTVNLKGPWLKTDRYYNNTPTSYAPGMPSTFACGVMNVSLQVFNKGNAPALAFNITDDKRNISVTHKRDLTFQDINASDLVASQILGSERVVFGTDNINLSGPYGRLDGIRFYNYTLNASYQTNGTFRFQAYARNATIPFNDQPYDLFVACGASPSIGFPAATPSPPTAGTVFNVSAVITNAGPGNATDVFSQINFTGGFNITNATYNYSNDTYVGTLGLESRTVTWVVNGSNVTAGSYTFCINATAWENLTSASACSMINLSAPTVVVEMDSPAAVSAEWGNTTGGWGFNWTFNVTVGSTHTENVTVRTWISKDGGTTYPTLLGERNYTPSSGRVNYTFSWDPYCGDISNPLSKIKFNNTVNSNSSELSFTVTKENTNFDLYFGNRSVANRTASETDLLTVRVMDKNGSIAGLLNVTFSITTDGKSYDSGFKNETNATGQANYYFNPSCSSPLYAARNQTVKFEIASDTCYQDNATPSNLFNITIMGQLNLSITSPDGSENYSQEETIPLLGAAFDDCALPIAPTVRYFLNYTNSSGAQGLQCLPVATVGANAFQCNYLSNISTPSTWYNVSMGGNLSYHWDNGTIRNGSAGLFFLDPIRRLVNQSVTPSSAPYTTSNWNFSVVASSGNNDNLTLHLYLKKAGESFNECLYPTCQNSTVVDCVGPQCVNQVVIWERNFSSTDISTWFYQVQMVYNSSGTVVTQTGGTDSFVVQDISTSPYFITLDNFARSPTSAGWGFNFTFNITASSNSTTNASIMLWRSQTGSEPFTLVENRTQNFTTKTDVNLSFDATPGDTDANSGTKTWYFKFNASDQNA